MKLNPLLSVVGLLLSTAVLLQPMAFSADEDGEKAAQTKTESTATPKAPPTKSRKESPDTFKPTEEISEDLSVPFPVDI